MLSLNSTQLDSLGRGPTEVRHYFMPWRDTSSFRGGSHTQPSHKEPFLRGGKANAGKIQFMHSSRQAVFTECLLSAWLIGKTSVNKANIVPVYIAYCLVKTLILNI